MDVDRFETTNLVESAWASIRSRGYRAELVGARESRRMMDYTFRSEIAERAYDEQWEARCAVGRNEEQPLLTQRMHLASLVRQGVLNPSQSDDLLTQIQAPEDRTDVRVLYRFELEIHYLDAMGQHKVVRHTYKSENLNSPHAQIYRIQAAGHTFPVSMASGKKGLRSIPPNRILEVSWNGEVEEERL